MTPRQRDILDFVRFELTNFGAAPSLQDIGDRFQISKTNVHKQIDCLVEQRKLRKHRYRVRGLELPDAPDLRAVDSALLRAELSRRGELLDALARPRAINLGSRAVTCAVDCCQVEVRRGHLMCWTHWSTLTAAMQRNIKLANAAHDVELYQSLVAEARDIAAAATARRVG